MLNFTNYDTEEILTYIESLEYALDVGKYLGVKFENSFTMITVKAQIYLLLGDLDTALELLEEGNDKIGHIVAELVWEEYSTVLFISSRKIVVCVK